MNKAPGFAKAYVARARAQGACIAAALLAASPLSAEEGAAGWRFKTMYNFNRTADGYPVFVGDLTRGPDGQFYGTAARGGDFGWGTVFKISPAGKMKVLHTFDSTGNTGGDPYGGLTLGPDGFFYGTTQRGGTSDQGLLYRISAQGDFAELHSFTGDEGAYAVTPPIVGPDGNLYGTTPNNQNHAPYGCGVVYRWTPGGEFTVLARLSRTHEGCGPDKLLSASDGYLYGVTLSAKDFVGGTVIRVSLSGEIKVLHAFEPTEGSFLYGPLIESAEGVFHAAAGQGGAFGTGTVFKVTRKGKVTVLHSFAADGSDGRAPVAGLAKRDDGYFYGTTAYGGANDQGTAFGISASGKLKVLHHFDCGLESCCEPGQLTVSLDGEIWGPTTYGGSQAGGTIFRMTQKAE